MRMYKRTQASAMNKITGSLTNPAVSSAPLIGEALSGGFFIGQIVVSGLTYNLIVSPASSLAYKQWKTSATSTPGTLSLNDGFANSEAMNNASHPAAQYCRSLNIGGFTDWYLPARDELELFYRNGKPTSGMNIVSASRRGLNFGTNGNGADDFGNGYNANSLPVGAAYSASSPSLTAASIFNGNLGGQQGFGGWHFSSTEGNAAFAWAANLLNGYQEGADTKMSNGFLVRAVRRVLADAPAALSRGYIAGGVGSDLYRSIATFDFTTKSVGVSTGLLSEGSYAGAGTQSVVKGYVTLGDTNSGLSNKVNSLVFASDAVALLAATLSTARDFPIGVSSALNAYFCGGSGSIGTPLNEIDGIAFATESAINPSASLRYGRARCGAVASAVAGYISGGYRAPSGTSNALDKLVFGTESVVQLGATLDVAKAYQGGSNSTTKGYYTGGDVNSTRVNAVTFSTDACSPLSASMGCTRENTVGMSSATNGYYSGGSSTVLSELSFTTETNVTLTAALPFVRNYAASMSCP